MTKISFVYILVVFLFFVGCADKQVACDFCGNFELANLSKNELNTTSESNVSIRHNLTVDANTGADFFTIWSWNKEFPDSSWTENIQKSIEIEQSQFSINEDGTWLWKLNTVEKFNSSPFFGENNYQINKEYSETGTWEYDNEKHKIITLHCENTVVSNQISLLNQTATLGQDYPITEKFFNQKTSTSRKFEITKDTITDQLVLKSVKNSDPILLEEIQNTTYSLAQGNVLLSLSVYEQPQSRENITKR